VQVKKISESNTITGTKVLQIRDSRIHANMELHLKKWGIKNE
jgi:hypothetical protein